MVSTILIIALIILLMGDVSGRFGGYGHGSMGVLGAMSETGGSNAA